MSRLEEIKEHVEWTTEKGIVPRIDDSDLDWLIEQAEHVEHLKNNQDRIIKIAENRLTYIIDLQNRVEALKEEKYQDPRQGMLEDLHMENEELKKRVKELEEENKQREKEVDILLARNKRMEKWMRSKMKENNRYKQALEEIFNYALSFSHAERIRHSRASPKGRYPMTEEQKFKEHENIVHWVINRLNLRQYERDDLVQAGSIGLLKAIRRFDESQGASFSTFAVTNIRGTILQNLRKEQSINIPEYILLLVNRIKKQELENESPATIAKKLDTTETYAEYALLAMNITTNSLDVTDDDGNPFIDTISTDSDDITGKLTLEEAFNRLTDDLKAIIYLRYHKDLSQSEIAKIKDVSQMTISRKERQALKLMREYLGEEIH